MNRKTLIGIIVVLVAAVGFSIYLKPTVPAGQVCTMEAKMCPDGSYVGRTGPMCEFAACPAAGSTSGVLWNTTTDAAQKITYQYPDHLLTTFIASVDWPPQVRITSGSFSCLEAGSEIGRAGKTEKRMVGNRMYCLTRESEGAAGSVYTMYAYITEKQGRLITLTFSLRAPQCDNYDDPQKTECKNERETFDIDGVVDRIVESIQFTQ